MRALWLALAAASCVASCGRHAEDAPSIPPQTATAAAAATPPGETVPHGDHNPHHGGLVLMNGDVHFEVVLGRDGTHQVYFSDAVRNELPAATAANVVVTTTQKGRPPETVALHIDDSGESWTGRGHPIYDPAATARVSYTLQGKPYFIDIPYQH